MKQVLLVEPNPTLRDIIKLNLMISVECDVILKQSANDALSIVQILPYLDLIICNASSNAAGEVISSYLETENRTTPLLIIGNVTSNYKHLTTVDESQSWEYVISIAMHVLGLTAKPASSPVTSPYVPVGIHYFLNLAQINIGCDVYIRVKKSDNNFQYVKRLHAGDHFSDIDIAKYKESGLEEFYIPRVQLSAFVNFVTTKLISQLGANTLQSEERFVLTSDSYKVTIDRIHSLGIDDHTVELVEESINSMKSSLQEKDGLSNFLKILQSNQLSYAYAHSYMCCLILHKIVASFAWNSPQVRDTLTHVAYFHDISLKNSDLMEINFTKDFEQKNISEADKKNVLNHALQSSILLNRFPKISETIVTIVKEHHGSKTGVGFPDDLSISLSAISMMFIVVEHFVSEFIKIPGKASNEDFKKIFSILEKRYTKATYLQTLTALHATVKTK